MGEFRMPSLGADMDTGTVAEWRVAPGDRVHRGDIVAVVSTDKSDIEVEVFEDGVVREILVPVGESVAVGTPLATIGAPGDTTAPPGSQPPSPAQGSRPTTPGPAVLPPPASSPPPVTSPLTRHLAEDAGVDLARVRGSGPGGAITRADVEAAAEGPPSALPQPATAAPARPRASPRARARAAAAGIELDALVGTGPGGAVVARDVPSAPSAGTAPGTPAPSLPAADVARDRIASRRAAIGALMSRSKREIPHYYLATTIDLAPARAWLANVNRDRPPGDRVVPAALLLCATARAAREAPAVNGHWLDGRFRPAETVLLGVAISLRGGGLVAPTIADAATLGPDELMRRLRDLTARARSGSLRASEMTDPTITVTNLGDRGVETVYGVIYPPQVAMVGFGTVMERPWAVDGMLAVHPVVNATLAADHRASDGHDGAAFLATVDRLLQHPEDL